ncbi:MAG: DUF1922 domain-containing protein [Candidatus Helarchaeota archaeon]|nr:DUF1922 domain-containing protein [Candidatus Helarchaeota archaeon]
MTFFKIFYCPFCRTLMYCPNTQKTKKCPNCQKGFKIKRLKIIKTTDSVQQAIYIVQALKLPPELRHITIDSKEKSTKIKGKKEKFLDFIQKFQETSTIKKITINSLMKEAEQVGFNKEWVLKQLIELEKLGLLIRPQKDYLQFLL